MIRGEEISAHPFHTLPELIPAGSLLVFNNTRVIRARLHFFKPSGGAVEIFCLDPVSPPEPESAFLQKKASVWKCLVGNSRKWRSGEVVAEHQGSGVCMRAERGATLPDGAFEIRFRWVPEELTFSEVLEHLGHIPLPPYIHRDDLPEDLERYQTIFAEREGSVAAPTAGLHFTEEVLKKLHARGCITADVTLHVGAGTFRPVTEAELSQHVMHSERIRIPLETLQAIRHHAGGPLIAVGTTSARTLESACWAGIRLIRQGAGRHPEVGQWDPYLDPEADLIPTEEALDALIAYLQENRLTSYQAETRLMIVPGYRYRLTGGLLTNFHMPRSTLLLLVSAFAGDVWKGAYRFALVNGFWFLSYGDATLFLK